jgi:dTDP-N-acetylfucosamine:lipid II N-acetylfucosaminyltransferase
MRYLHIMPHNNTGITATYTRFVSDFFSPDEHEFLLWENADSKETKLMSTEVTIRPETVINRSVVESFKNYDKVLFHIMKISRKDMIYILLHRSIYKKIVWVPWGKDLYKWDGNSTHNVKSRLGRYLTYSFYKNLRYFVGIFPPDVDFYKKKFHSKAKAFYAPYSCALYYFYKDNQKLFEGINELISGDSHEKKKKNNPQVNILIGHNCSLELKHIDMLDTVNRFNEENIKLYLPLSYDNKDNGDSIEEHANLLFGEKSLCIRKFMSDRKYAKLLNEIDIAIFHTDRQQALGNIQMLLLFGKKVYLSESGVMYKHFSEMGFKVHKFESISGMTYQEFISNQDMSITKKNADERIKNIQAAVDDWEKVFTS